MAKKDKSKNKQYCRLPGCSLSPSPELTQKQLGFRDSLRTNTLTISTGPAGTGKTMVACYEALRAWDLGQVSKIVITRPMVTVEESIGSLPGDVNEKFGPYLVPGLEYFMEFTNKNAITSMLRMEAIVLVPFALLRGYTFKDAFVIVDEAQNTTVKQMRTILTRLGEGSTMCVLGDLDQCDLRNVSTSGLKDLTDRLDRKGIPDDVGISEFGIDDVMRSRLVRDVLKLYED